ncbi:MAG: isoprenoid biosynthesis glyoxalase ElbB [Flavobacteriales bacterium]|nr:isoprenoid biosynthesis glyoxalase ElbB [Flavobacteriales bacterium]
MRIGVLLSGSGVYDGSEIHEAVFTLLSIDERGAQYQLFAPNKDQLQVIDHLTGNEMSESRNVLTEAARIARGAIEDISGVHMKDLDALVIPGGFGVAKNLNTWALSGPESEIDPEVKRIVLEAVDGKKPIAALCMGPTVVAKALQGTGHHATLTVGTTEASSPYDIKGISEGLAAVGAKPVMKTVHQIAVDNNLKLVTAPCYMMDARISEIRDNIDEAIDKLFEFFPMTK